MAAVKKKGKNRNRLAALQCLILPGNNGGRGVNVFNQFNSVCFLPWRLTTQSVSHRQTNFCLLTPNPSKMKVMTMVETKGFKSLCFLKTWSEYIIGLNCTVNKAKGGKKLSQQFVHKLQNVPPLVRPNQFIYYYYQLMKLNLIMTYYLLSYLSLSLLTRC